MQAALNVDKLAYCTIEIEGASVPPSKNMLSSILIMDGFGIGLPVLQLLLNDEQESLSQSLAIKDGTRITIQMGKDTRNIVTRTFRIFGWKRGRGVEGPRIEVVALLDVPRFGAGAYTEAFKMSSAEVMAQIASACALQYDGPSFTDDVMPWINLNTTRLSFTEDVAMRGFISEQSAMARCVTMNGVLRYKNLFDVLAQRPAHTFVHDSGGAGLEGKIVVVREARDASTSGISTHYVNYGQKHYTHSLLGENSEIVSITAPLLGAGLPVNEHVRAEITGSRVTYSGFDPGTFPSEDANVHQNYEKAFYQNLRFLSLFSERMTLLVEECTDAQTFDPVAYVLNTLKNNTMQPAKDVTSKYLLGGKAIQIKNGLRYAEVHYLYRPFITVVGLGAVSGSDSSAVKSKQNATASASGTVFENIEAPTNLSSQLNIAAVPSVPSVQAARNSMSSLIDFDSVMPRLPYTTVNLDVSSRSIIDNVRSSTNALSNVGGPLGDAIKSATQIPADTSFFQKAVHLNKDFLGDLTNNFDVNRIASDIDLANSNMASFKQSAISRVSGSFSDFAGFSIKNIVSAATGGKYNVGKLVGEVLGGGIWALDLEQNGVGVVDLPFDLPILDTAAAKVGTTFLMNVTGVGITSENITINPYKVAKAINDFAASNSPESLLLTRGADAYLRTFGSVSNAEAQSTLQELAILSAKVMKQYGQSEYLADAQRTDKALTYFGKEGLFSFGGEGITPLAQSVEKIVDYGDYVNVETAAKAKTWAKLYSMGKNVANNVGRWEPPVFTDTVNETDKTAGLSNTLDTNMIKYLE